MTIDTRSDAVDAAANHDAPRARLPPSLAAELHKGPRTTPRGGRRPTRGAGAHRLAQEVQELQAQPAAAKNDRGALRMELDRLRKGAA